MGDSSGMHLLEGDTVPRSHVLWLPLVIEGLFAAVRGSSENRNFPSCTASEKPMTKAGEVIEGTSKVYVATGDEQSFCKDFFPITERV